MRHRIGSLALLFFVALGSLAWAPAGNNLQLDAERTVLVDQLSTFADADGATVAARPIPEIVDAAPRAIPAAVAPAADRASAALDPIAAPASSRYVAAEPLRDYTFVAPPTASGQPLRLLVALHGMGDNGQNMAIMLGPLAAQQGWALLAPTMPYRDYRDPELVRRDGELLPRLRALIDALPARTGHTFQPQVLLFGFSRGSQEAIRFSLMFPEVSLGVAGLSAGSYTLPSTTQADGRALKYPYGTADVDSICGQKFDAAATQRVAYWIGVGAADTRSEDVPRQWDALVGTNRVERAGRFVEIMKQFGAQASLEVFPGAGHEVTAAMRDQAFTFLTTVGPKVAAAR